MTSTAPGIVSLALLSALAALAACRATTDLGVPCVLVRQGDGGQPEQIDESELEPGKDYISLGAVECDELVCVRDLTMTPSGSGAAAGYCSNPCAETAQSGPSSCAGAATEFKHADDPFACRALLLDEQTLAGLCASDPERCKALFGDNRSPFYCARGSAAAQAAGGQ